jgi:uncharacterized protein (TIGR02118 family)
MSDNESANATDTMSTQCDRRAVLAGTAKAAAAGITAAVGVTVATSGAAAESTVGQECMTILYENGDGVSFDFDYYENTHMPLIMSRYGDSIGRFELRRGQPGADGARPPYIATVSIWIADGAAFDAAAEQHQAGLRADVPKFTNARLIAQRDRVVAITA